MSPETILEHAARSDHHAAEEVAELAFAGALPDARTRLPRDVTATVDNEDVMEMITSQSAAAALRIGTAVVCT